MASTATLGLSSYAAAGRSRSRLPSAGNSTSTNDNNHTDSPKRPSSYVPLTLPRKSSITLPNSNPIVQYTKDVERMRCERESVTGSNTSLDRAGLTSSPKSPGPLYSAAAPPGPVLRSRVSYGAATPATAAAAPMAAPVKPGASRNSILDPSDLLKPMMSSGSPYGRARAPSTSESAYDYSSRSGSLVRRRPTSVAGSREPSMDRSRDLRSRSGRRVPNGDGNDDVDDETSLGSNTTTYRSTLPPHATSHLTYAPSHHGIPVSHSRPELSHSGSSLQRYDSTSSLRSGRYPASTPSMPNSSSSGTLQRYGSNSSLSAGARFSSRRSSRGDLSVNFDLSKQEKRERSPILLVSRVAVEKELPTGHGDVESRYVVGKFSSSQEGVRNVPIQILTETYDNVREKRGVSTERSVSGGTPVVSRASRDPVKVQPISSSSNGVGVYGRMQSGERVVGGKQFLSDSSLGDTSSSDDETLGKHGNSIIRAASPPSARRPGLISRKVNFSVDESDKAGLIGLKNLGNTCFMNSILQCLSNTRPLRDYCLLGEYDSEVNTTTSQMKGALISAFAAMLEALWKRHTSYSASSPYVPDKFHRQVQQYAPRFSGYLQQDAQEFLRYLLEGLHEDVNRVTEKPRAESADIPHTLSDSQKSTESWKRYLRRDNSKIVDLFVGQLKSSLICESCGYCSVTCDPFWDLSLPIPGSRGGRRSDPGVSTNLTECFKLFTKEEMLEGDECPTCCHCKTRQKCRKFFSIQRFPQFFVLHLKRFSQERYRAKLSTLVDYPVDRLDLTAFAAESYQGPAPLYSLYAVSCHSGSTHCGHYTAFCKHPNSGKWSEYNDARISSARPADVVTSEAYVLFYELIS